MHKATLKTLGAVAALLLSGSVLAKYPDHAIKMIVPFPPGGVTDTVARPIADALSRDLGQSVVVENKARSEEHTSELQSLMRISYAVFCLKKKKNDNRTNKNKHTNT